MPTASSYILVTTTCDDRDALQRIAQHLVESRLAACVQISGPVQSTYRWEGKVESAAEWKLQAKSRVGLWSELTTTLKSLHPYQLPELIATAVADVSPEYARWLDESLRQ